VIGAATFDFGEATEGFHDQVQHAVHVVWPFAATMIGLWLAWKVINVVLRSAFDGYADAYNAVFDGDWSAYEEEGLHSYEYWDDRELTDGELERALELIQAEGYRIEGFNDAYDTSQDVRPMYDESYDQAAERAGWSDEIVDDLEREDEEDEG
jgi:hypothetical protein